MVITLSISLTKKTNQPCSSTTISSRQYRFIRRYTYGYAPASRVTSFRTAPLEISQLYQSITAGGWRRPLFASTSDGISRDLRGPNGHPVEASAFPVYVFRQAHPDSFLSTTSDAISDALENISNPQMWSHDLEEFVRRFLAANVKRHLMALKTRLSSAGRDSVTSRPEKDFYLDVNDASVQLKTLSSFMGIANIMPSIALQRKERRGLSSDQVGSRFRMLRFSVWKTQWKKTADSKDPVKFHRKQSRSFSPAPNDRWTSRVASFGISSICEAASFFSSPTYPPERMAALRTAIRQESL